MGHSPEATKDHERIERESESVYSMSTDQYIPLYEEALVKRLQFSYKMCTWQSDLTRS